MSQRQKKKLVNEGVARLKAKPGWDPAAFKGKTPTEQLRDLHQAQRTLETAAEAETCDACTAARAATDDPTALCDAHLEAALGFR